MRYRIAHTGKLVTHISVLWVILKKKQRIEIFEQIYLQQ